MRKKWDTCKVSADCKGAYWDILRQHWRDCCAQVQDANYESQKSDLKMRYLLSNIYNDNSKNTWPDMIGIMSQSVVTSFLNNRDEMPAGRKKMLHSVGWHSSFKFIPSVHFGVNQTGVLGEESIGIVRFSLMKQQDAKNRLIPAVSLKFLRNSVTSCNILAMSSLDGQLSSNFFERDFKNHISKPRDFVNKIMMNKFKQASNCNLCTGLKHCAQYDSNGDEVGFNEVRFPFMLTLRPKITFDEFAIHSTQELDFAFINIEPNTEVFEVIAHDHPEHVKSNLSNVIGSIRVLSPVSNSIQGDKTLFFKHQYFEEDLAMNEDWIESMSENEKEIGCGNNCNNRIYNDKCS